MKLETDGRLSAQAIWLTELRTRFCNQHLWMDPFLRQLQATPGMKPSDLLRTSHSTSESFSQQTSSLPPSMSHLLHARVLIMMSSVCMQPPA